MFIKGGEGHSLGTWRTTDHLAGGGGDFSEKILVRKKNCKLIFPFFHFWTLFSKLLSKFLFLLFKIFGIKKQILR